MRPTAPSNSVSSPAEVEQAYAAAQCVVQTHRRLAEWLRTGQTLAQIDAFVAQTLSDLKCRSCFLGYRVGRLPPFPSHACLSLNACVVHGTAGYVTEPMKRGDVLKIDIGVTHRGWIGDAAWTYVFQEASDEVRRLCAAGRECLTRGIRQLRPGNLYLEWAKAVQTHVEDECGFHLIRGYGGHGYGRQLHAPPFISNVVGQPGDWPDGLTKAKPGTLLAVEPMIAVGTGEVLPSKRSWPVFTADGSNSVHYEHDVLITETGPRVLTEGLDDLPDIVG